MNGMSELRPGIYGAIFGGIAAMAIGFGAGGWYLGSSADSLATARSKVAVIDALIPVCVNNQRIDPEGAGKLAALTALKTSYEQRDFVMKSGWATIPDTKQPDRDLAAACADALAKPAAG